MGLHFEKIKIMSANFNGESSIPPLALMTNAQNMTVANLDEDDGLFIGYGYLNSIFPYRMQDLYDRSLSEHEFQAAILENDYLKAVFLPELGGRLWSLYDKKAGKDLLYENPVVRPCNLAVRNAWCSGGIEFNCGMIGHGPFTCDKMFVAKTKLSDGTDVLRLYEFERIRACVYQMDFFLPKDSAMLYGRMRIVNPNDETIPMYWWTNIAVPEGKEYRTISNAHEAFSNEGNTVQKVKAPIHNGIDITYPTNNPIAIDYFWKIPDKERKFVAYLDQNGYGFFQASTERQKGRKLFVWGQGSGGSRWQEFLTEDSSIDRYVEIQAGVGRTQYECIPMPPNSAWEWLEVFGSMNAEADKIHADWDGAISEVTEKLDVIISEDVLEMKLAETHDMAVSHAETVFTASAWGELENIRRRKENQAAVCPYLDFGSISPQQQPWLELLENGILPKIKEDSLPQSWMLQKEWTNLLLQSEDGHEKYLHLAAIYVATAQLELASESIQKAFSFRRSIAALFIAGQVARLSGNKAQWADYLEEAHRMIPEDISLAREALNAQLSAEKLQDVIYLYENAPESVTNDGRSSMLYAFALLRSGNIDAAEQMLYRDGGLVVGDIRECEESLTQLYIDIVRAKFERDGKPFDIDTISIPKQFDFRMFVV